MSQQVYSHKLIATLLTATNTVYYQAPAGFVVSVKCMTLGWITSGTVDGVSTVLTGSANGVIWSPPFKAAERASALWNGMFVLEPGDTIRASTQATGAVYLYVAGFVLSLP